MPMTSGDSPVSPVDTMRASGVRSSSRAFVSLMTTIAAAPWHSLVPTTLRERREALVARVVHNEGWADGVRRALTA